MSLILSFDVETTGFPRGLRTDYTLVQDDDARLISVGLAVGTLDGKILESYGALVKPDGFEWDETNKAFAIHNITYKRACEEGKSIAEVMDIFFQFVSKCDVIIAYNMFSMDKIVLLRELNRLGRQDLITIFESKQQQCVMELYKKVGPGGRKYSLEEVCYPFCFGCKRAPERAHNALFDAEDTLLCYGKLLALSK